MKSKLNNPIALAALSAAMRSNPPRPECNSRTAEKFVVRASNEVMAAMAALGKHQGRSANSEITCAVLESLAGRQRAITKRKVLSAYLGPEASQKVLQQQEPFDRASTRGEAKKVIRLPDGVRLDIWHAVERSIAEGGHLRSMNTWLVDAMFWWINNQRETYALLGACVEMEFASSDEAQG